MAKVNAKTNTVQTVAKVASVAQTVAAPSASPVSAYVGLKYIANADGTLFANIAQLAASLASNSATQEQLVNAACVYYGINATTWHNKHNNKGGKGCLTTAKSLAATQATQAQLVSALLAQVASQPKGGKYAPALAALLALGTIAKVQSVTQAALALCAVAWAWGYLANKQANGNKGNIAGALATLALPVA